VRLVEDLILDDFRELIRVELVAGEGRGITLIARYWEECIFFPR
jgi:hypothetical protein